MVGIINLEFAGSPEMGSSTRYVFFGLSLDKKTGIWSFEDNSTLDYHSWNPRQPDNANGNEACGALLTSSDLGPGWFTSGWNDMPCDSKLNALCQKNALSNTSSGALPMGQNSNFTILIGVLGLLIVLTIALTICCYFRKKVRKHRQNSEHSFSTVQTRAYRSEKETCLTPNMSPMPLITLNQLVINDQKLGEGEFGIVYAAKYIIIDKASNTKKYPVAVKVIKEIPKSEPNMEQDTIIEAGIMARLQHEHLLKLVGICVADGLKIVTPLRPLGSLQKFLQTKINLVGPKEQILYCYQVSSAMEYLAKNRIVHRDLATRNILMKRNYHVEVTDFGLSAVLEGTIRNPQKMAFKWVPMECLINFDCNLYCEATDVWSFGVTCWEILTFARLPYEKLILDRRSILSSMYQYLADGKRLERPTNCGLELYQVLLICWASNPKSRPTFSTLKETFEKFTRNPYSLIIDQRNKKNPMISTNDSLDEQINMINKILGDDEYLYDEVKLKLK